MDLWVAWVTHYSSAQVAAYEEEAHDLHHNRCDPRSRVRDEEEEEWPVLREENENPENSYSYRSDDR